MAACFFQDSTAPAVILPIFICLIIVMLLWGKTEHVLKTDGDKLFKDLLTNKILSSNVKMELCLNRGLVWEFLGWKLINVTAFFLQTRE